MLKNVPYYLPVFLLAPLLWAFFRKAVSFPLVLVTSVTALITLEMIRFHWGERLTRWARRIYLRRHPLRPFYLETASGSVIDSVHIEVEDGSEGSFSIVLEAPNHGMVNVASFNVTGAHQQFFVPLHIPLRPNDRLHIRADDENALRVFITARVLGAES